jgi:Protein of unknown function (DUF1629)
MANRIVVNFGRKSWLEGGPDNAETYRLMDARYQAGLELARSLPFANLMQSTEFDCKTEGEAKALGLSIEGLHRLFAERHRGLLSGYPIDPALVSKRGLVRAKDRKSGYSEMLGFAGYNLVSDKIREVIQTFAPNVHQFLPFEIAFRDGTTVTGYSIMNIQKILDAISVEHSRLIAHPPQGAQRFTHYTIGADTRREIWRDIVAGHHLFLDARFRETYVSDALAAELKPLLTPYFHFEPIREL